MTLLPWKRKARESGPQTSGFEELAMPLLPSLYNVARWLTRDTAEAEDLVQETFLKALRGFASFEPGSNFKAWIFRILRNAYLTSRTGLAAMRTVSLEETVNAEGSDEGLNSERYLEATIDLQTPEVNLLRLADRAALQSVMAELPQLQLEVILLCDVEEMKYKDIAVVLDLPIGTVMSRIARARATLRRTLLEQAKLPREARS